MSVDGAASGTRPADGRADVRSREERLRSVRTPFVLATVVRTERPTSSCVGDRALLLPDGTLEGFVGGVCAESSVRDEGLRLLHAGESALLRISPGEQDTGAGEDHCAEEGGGHCSGEPAAPSSSEEGVVTVVNPCLSGGTMEILLESVLPPPLVRVFGDSPVARALAVVGASLGYDVHPSTDAGDPVPADAGAVVVASHGRDEERMLTAALRAGVPYIGLVASPRRGAAVLAGLEAGEEERARISTPAGLDIGARFPGEIALSIFAEMVQWRSRGGAAPSCH